MDFARISVRLRLGKKYRLASSYVKQLYQAFHDNSTDKVGCIQLTALQEQGAALLDLYRTLKNNPTPQQNPVGFDYVERIINFNP